MKTVAVICSVALCSVGYAQRCDECNEALRFGTYNLIQETQFQDKSQYFDILFSKSFDEWTLIQTQKDEFHDDEITAGIPGLAYFNQAERGFSSQDEFREHYTSTREAYRNRSVNMNQALSEFRSQILNPIPYEVWSKCITGCQVNNKDAFAFFIRRNVESSDKWSLHLIFRPRDRAQYELGKLKVTLTLQNATVDGRATKQIDLDAFLISPELTVLVSDEKKDAQLTMSYGAETESRVLPTLFKIYYRDRNGDGQGDANLPKVGITKPPGYVLNNTDKNDDKPLNISFQNSTVNYHLVGGGAYNMEQILITVRNSAGDIVESPILKLGSIGGNVLACFNIPANGIDVANTNGQYSRRLVNYNGVGLPGAGEKITVSVITAGDGLPDKVASSNEHPITWH